VKEAIDLFGRDYRKEVPTATSLQEAFLADKKDSHVGKLSDSQKQQLALALALVNYLAVLFPMSQQQGLVHRPGAMYGASLNAFNTSQQGWCSVPNKNRHLVWKSIHDRRVIYQ